MTGTRMSARFQGRCAAKRCAARRIRPGDRIVFIARGKAYHERCIPADCKVQDPAPAARAYASSWDRRADLN